MVCCEMRYVETDCACELCGLDIACGDRARAQSEPDGTLSWVCEECWRDMTDHYPDDDAPNDDYADADIPW